MAKLGSPVTPKFSIGTAEVRIGALSDANKLKQANSIGLVDDATVEVSQNSVDLLGGFPQTIVDTAIVSQESTVTATMREYSKRNIQVMLGDGVQAYTTDVATTVDAALALGATAVSVVSETGFAAGDVIVIYPDGRPEEVTIALVDATAAGSLTLNTDTPTLFAYDGTAETIHVYKAFQTAIGGVNETNYFSLQMVQAERSTGRPLVFNFWKAAVGAGMTVGTNATDFASTELNVKVLQPTASEYAVGQPLAHLASIIPSHPVGMYVAGGDQ